MTNSATQSESLLDDDVILHSEGKFTFGSSAETPFSPAVRKVLLEAVSDGPIIANSPLGGRNCITIKDVPELGRVVIKQYMRGGLLQHFISERYLKHGSARSQIEFQLLHRARAVGVNVPDPLGFCFCGALFYKAWLFTREIQGKRTVAELSLNEENDIHSVMDEIVNQVGLLIQARIFHVDLHPGNVLVDPIGKVFILDFDKAQGYNGRPNDLRDKYLCRWRRAVIKHELPEILSELMSHGLRQSFE